MKEIPLTQGKVALVDDEDYEKVIQYKWIFQSRKGCAVRTIAKGGGKVQYLSHFLYPIQYNIKSARPLDGNKLNYTRSNILILTSSEVLQGKNQKKNNKYTSGFVGVCWNKEKGKWTAQICIKRTMYRLGYFSKELEASAAYNKKAVELYGENAKLNPLPIK